MRGPAGSDWPFVGRERDLDRAMTTIGRGAADVVLLLGPPGVGKSRLARECLARATQADLRSARIYATAAAAAVPLGALAPLLPRQQGWAEAPGDATGWVVEQLRGDDDRVVVLVDDAHLLDEASATVVHQLAKEGCWRLVLTVRADRCDAPPVATVCADLQVERFELGPLTRDDVVRLAVAALGGPVDGACARDLWAASRGNPLFLRELVLGALATGLLRSEGGLWRLLGRFVSTARLAELISARLADLDDDERDALHLVALGEPLATDVLATLRITPAVVLRLEERGLVTRADTADGQHVGLAHPMYGEVLRDDLTAITRLSISRRLADAFEQAGVDQADLLRVAVWRLEGGGAGDPALLLEAARRAYFAHEAELAERLARDAIDSGARLEAGVLLAQVLGDLGRHDERYRLLSQLEPAASTHALRALVVIDRALAAFWGLDRGDEALGLLRETELTLPPGAWRDEVRAQRATLELLAGRPRVALELAAPLLDAEAGRVAVTAAIAAAPALAVCGRGDEAVGVADRALATHLRLGDQEVLSNLGIHVVSRALALTEAGHLRDAEVTLTAGYDVAVGGRNNVGQAWLAMLRGRWALLTGRLGAAALWFREGAAVFEDLAQDGPRRWCLAGLVLVAAQQADRTSAAAALTELDTVGDNCMLMMEPDVMRARAWERVADGDLDGARGRLIDAAAVADCSGSHALAAAAWHDLARLGDAEQAAASLSALSSTTEGPLVPARAAHAEAILRRDADGLAAAVDRFEGLGALLFAAEAAAAGSAELRRAQRSRHAGALAARAGELLAGCEGARTPPLTLLGQAAELTRREREVAVLAARGLSSRVIASRLGLSVRTVDSHLHRAYVKLDVTSRAALATALGQP